MEKRPGLNIITRQTLSLIGGFGLAMLQRLWGADVQDAEPLSLAIHSFALQV